jgi:hypothetical protein
MPSLFRDPDPTLLGSIVAGLVTIPLLTGFQSNANGRISGQVVDASSSQPAAGARVTLSDYGPPKRQAIADNDGRFVLDGSPAGWFALRAGADGYWQAEPANEIRVVSTPTFVLGSRLPDGMVRATTRLSRAQPIDAFERAHLSATNDPK